MFYEGRFINIDMVLSQLTFTCSTSITKTLKKGVKFVQSEQKKKSQNDVIYLILVFLLLTLYIFDTFSNVSIVDFELVHFKWEQRH